MVVHVSRVKKRVASGTSTFDDIESFKKSLSIGDTFWIPIEDMGIEWDSQLQQIQECKIVKLYPHHAYMEHEHISPDGTKKYTHKCCINYPKLFLLYKWWIDPNKRKCFYYFDDNDGNSNSNDNNPYDLIMNNQYN